MTLGRVPLVKHQEPPSLLNQTEARMRAWDGGIELNCTLSLFFPSYNTVLEGICRGLKGALDLDLEFQEVVSCPVVGANNTGPQ